jgi:hypothetical protein
MEATKKLWIKLKSPQGEDVEVVFNTTHYSNMTELLEQRGFKDFKVIDWKIKRVIFMEC